MRVVLKKSAAKKAVAKKAAPKTKRSGGKVTRVNFDMDTPTYSGAAETCKKFEKSVSVAGRLFLAAVEELGRNGAKSIVAKAAQTLLSQEAPEGSRTPNGLGKKEKKAAAPVKVKAKAAPAVAARPVVKAKAPVAVARPAAAPAAARPAVPVKFVLRIPRPAQA